MRVGVCVRVYVRRVYVRMHGDMLMIDLQRGERELKRGCALREHVVGVERLAADVE